MEKDKDGAKMFRKFGKGLSKGLLLLGGLVFTLLAILPGGVAIVVGARLWLDGRIGWGFVLSVLGWVTVVGLGGYFLFATIKSALDE